MISLFEQLINILTYMNKKLLEMSVRFYSSYTVALMMTLYKQELFF